MTTNDEIRALLEAQEEGKAIECAGIGCSDWRPHLKGMSWNFQHFVYRLRPEKEYRPYESATEFLAAQKLHGRIKDPTDPGRLVNVFVDTDGRVMFTYRDGSVSYLSFRDLFLPRYAWEDGERCAAVKREG